MENFIFCAVFRFYLSHKFYNKNWTLFYPRWNVFFDPLKDEKDKHNHTNESDINVVNMNNYFGVGIGSELCLEFHLSREENPEKFNSRYVVIITQYLRKCIMYHRSDVSSCFLKWIFLNLGFWFFRKALLVKSSNLITEHH